METNPSNNSPESGPQYKSILYDACQDVVLVPLKPGEQALELQSGYCPVHLDQD